MNTKKIAGAVLALSFILSPIMASAQTSNSAQVQAILAQIQTLKLQLDALKSVQAQAVTATTNVSDTLDLIRTLKEGMSGDDVAALQAILATDSSIYPEGTIDGNFSSTTTKALRKFQKKYGIDTLGFAGPKTLKKMNKIIREIGLSKNGNGSKEDRFCLKLPLKAYVTPGWYNKNGKKKVKIEECQKKFNEYINNPNNGWVSSTTPSISNQASASVVIGGTIYDRATISGGNMPTGTISFNVYGPWDGSCTTPISPAPASTAVNGNGMYNSGNITATTTGTYKFIASYSGDSKNKSISTNCNSSGNSVLVTAVPDTTAPVISSFGTSNLLGTTTSIIWTTNENSNSKVWFGTSTPLSLTHPATKLVSDSSLVTSHSLQLSGLATSTTYYFKVVSTDGANNTATSTEGVFTTTIGL
jgi:peptidoglycan hydrolase-like protein with peptidoglycan-binding domain